MTFPERCRRISKASDGNHRLASRSGARYELSMTSGTTTRKLLVSLLTLVIALWAEARLALIEGDQVLQCSMSAHEMQAMGDMPCCPGEEMLSLRVAPDRPPCCSVSNAPERPLGFEVSSKRVTSQPLDAMAESPTASILTLANSRGAWQSADASRFVKPVLELKTDLRI